MTLQVFAIRDTKAEAYGRPFFSSTKGLALRSFIEAAQDKNEPLGKYPADYHLFHIAEYDDSTGIIMPLEVKQNLGCAIDFLEADKPTLKNVNDTERSERVKKAVEEFSRKENRNEHN